MSGTNIGIEAARGAIETVVLESNLDNALSTIQKVAGITEGDVAGVFFSEFDEPYEHWEQASKVERSELLKRYLDMEAVN